MGVRMRHTAYPPDRQTDRRLFLKTNKCAPLIRFRKDLFGIMSPSHHMHIYIYIILYYIMLYYIILYYSILYYIILYYVILYILYYFILFY